VVEIKAVLVDLTILFYVTAFCLKLTRAKNQGKQRKTSIECVTKKVTIRETVPCLSKSDLTVLRRKIIVKPRKQKKQGT
jgi:hypothetical protein